MITLADVEGGRWRVNPALAPAVAPREGFDVEAWGRHYARRLAEGGKYPLVVWPYHSMVGGIGHAMVSAVEEAVFFHAIARQSPTRVEIKGRNPLTENYSVLRPEVMEDASGSPIASANRDLVEHLLSFDTVIVAGEAQSHCVAWTVEDLLAEIRARDPRLAREGRPARRLHVAGRGAGRRRLHRRGRGGLRPLRRRRHAPRRLDGPDGRIGRQRGPTDTTADRCSRATPRRPASRCWRKLLGDGDVGDSRQITVRHAERMRACKRSSFSRSSAPAVKPTW